VANNLLDMAYITNKALVVLENELVFANRVTREYSDEFAQTGAKVGNTVNIRRPPRYLGTYGPPLNVEDTNETFIQVVLNYQFHVDVQFTTQDLALAMDLFADRVLRPQIAAIANRVDADSYLYCMLNTAAQLGTPGVSPNSLKLFTDARALLANEACPREGEKNVVLDPTSMSSAVATIQGLFNPQAKIGEYIEAGLIAREFAGLDWWEDQNTPVFTTGAQGGTPVFSTGQTSTALLATGWAQSGTLYTTGWTNSTGVIKVGDVIQIGTPGGAGVYPVNPQNRNQYGKILRQFVVLPPGGFVSPPNGQASTGLYFSTTQPSVGTFNNLTGVYTSNGSGQLMLTIGDPVVSGGQFQNVTAAPVNGATITVNQGTTYANTVTPQSLVFHKYAFALAFADLPLPRGVEFAARAYDDEDIGMSIRCVTQYTVNNDSEPTRADVLYGPASLYRTLGLRMCG
jgi:hypothetical protein